MVETARSKMSKDLEQEGRELEKALTISTAKLKEITDHFVKELIKGNILIQPMIQG